MRSRVLSSYEKFSTRCSETTTNQYLIPPSVSRSTIVTNNVSVGPFATKASNISDKDPQTAVQGFKTQRTKRTWAIQPSTSVEFALRHVSEAEALRPINRCSHTVTKCEIKNLPIRAQHTETLSAGNRIYTKDLQFDNAVGFMAKIMGISTSGVSSILAANGAWTGSPYRNHDWFHLVDSLREASHQYLPSAFLIGEDIVENAIFKDAFKAIINPSRALKLLFDIVKVGAKKYKGLNVEHTIRKASQDGANANLFYNFGIMPAISDIKDTWEAHQKVSSRLSSLHQNAGSFVPIRVRSQLASDLSNNSDPLWGPGYHDSWKWVADSKVNLAILGMYGRVREDLNWEDTWSAYLQYFGINKMPGLAWELIPFSFVADWFTNAQERINYYTRQDTGGPFAELTKPWYSTKQSTIEDFTYYPGINNVFGVLQYPSGPLSLIKRTKSTYYRDSGIPDTSGVVDISTLGTFHATISASLLLQLDPVVYIKYGIF